MRWLRAAVSWKAWMSSVPNFGLDQSPRTVDSSYLVVIRRKRSNFARNVLSNLVGTRTFRTTCKAEPGGAGVSLQRLHPP